MVMAIILLASRAAVMMFPAPLFFPAARAQDLGAVLEKADKLLEESKTAYEEAREKSSAQGFVEAGFKLEEARIKYLVLQEIGQGDQQATAADRLRAVNQLSKLIHDAKVAVAGTPASAASAKDPAPKSPDAPEAPASPAAKSPSPLPASVSVKEALKRLAIPDAAKQKEAEALVRELFKDQYAKKAPADRKELAALLLEQAARAQEDPASQYVLFHEALDASLHAGEVRIAGESIDGMARIFDFDPLPLKSSAWATMVKAARSLEELAVLADAHLRLADEYAAVDQYEPADKTCTVAVGLAKKSTDQALLARATSRSKELAEAKSRFQTLKRVLETLAKNPVDSQANLEMGQYVCFVKGNWDLGICFLGKGSDAVLKSLAEREKAFPAGAPERLALADGWWDLGQKESSPLRKGQILAHAGSLYAACLAELSPLIRLRVQKRLDSLKPAGAGQALLGPSVDLLKMTDPKKDSVTGEWKLERDVLTMPAGTPGASVHWIQIPYVLPDEYDLKIVAARKSGTHDLFIHLVGGGRTMLMHLDGCPSGNKMGIQTVDGKNWEDNETTVRDTKLFVDDKPHTVFITVRKNRLTMAFDGKVYIDWKTDFTKLRGEEDIPNPKALGLANWETSFELSQILIVPVSGQGKKIGHVR